jgi:hypothetical protein
MGSRSESAMSQMSRVYIYIYIFEYPHPNNSTWIPIHPVRSIGRPPPLTNQNPLLCPHNPTLSLLGLPRRPFLSMHLPFLHATNFLCCPYTPVLLKPRPREIILFSVEVLVSPLFPLRADRLAQRPSGTGKTCVLEAILTILRRKHPDRMLLVTATNGSVLCSSSRPHSGLTYSCRYLR